MQTTTDTPAPCDFHPHGAPQEPSYEPGSPPNASMMGVVTLDERGAFVSSRLLTPAELEEAWTAHRSGR